MDRHSRKSGLTTSTDLQGRGLKRYVDTNHYVNALAILREADRYESKLEGCSVAAALDGYRDLLAERSYFDYSSILEAAVESPTNDPDLRRRLAERLRYVIVDEYQRRRDSRQPKRATSWPSRSTRRSRKRSTSRPPRGRCAVWPFSTAMPNAAWRGPIWRSCSAA